MVVAIFWLIVLGLAAYFVRRCPIDEPFKTGIIILLCIVGVAIVLSVLFGVEVFPGFPSARYVR